MVAEQIKVDLNNGVEGCYWWLYTSGFDEWVENWATESGTAMPEGGYDVAAMRAKIIATMWHPRRRGL